MNKPGQQSCSRCSGSLAPSPAQGRQPHPVLPITRRAEVTRHRAGITGDGAAGTLKAPPAGLGRTSAGPAPQAAPGTGHADIYLLATDRSTGQPAPPEALSAPTETALGERRGRMAIGLSGA
jgi:hypothetical protein